MPVMSIGLAAVMLATVGCNRGDRDAAAPRVEIVAPADGDTVSQPFTVRMAASGIAVVPASGMEEEGRGHHHLVVDADLPAAGTPLPSGGGFVHIGTGESERAIDSLAAGPHRIIAVLGYGNHVPIPGAHTDTITIVVR